MEGKFEILKHKIHDLTTMKRQMSSWHLKSDKVVFTNGCFDILHRGHVTYLAQAAELGNKLVVGLNTDASVRRQGKGEGRPVNDQESRAIVLASLHLVDAVVLFDEDTPLELIRALMPDVLVKGGDYDAEESNPASKKYIVGSDLVKSKGGKVVTIPLVDGFSTTSTIAKLKS
ncbi:MAG: D-glycero-beta-D-manno-heptose 1-phosphate adenylyltransferase [Flavobacteriales bacterium]|nr:D-glycero-beta-D-manno-heptose 1-phosphate adenylyltransferase [Flavobacteriales bacterium]